MVDGERLTMVDGVQLNGAQLNPDAKSVFHDFGCTHNPCKCLPRGPVVGTLDIDFSGRRREFSVLYATLSGTRRRWRRATRPAGPGISQ